MNGETYQRNPISCAVYNELADRWIYINIEQSVLRMIKLFFVDFNEGWIKGVLNS